MPEKVYIICIGGFRQGTGERSGLFKLCMKLQKFRGPNVSVELCKWDTRFSDVAERIFLETEDCENIRIVVAAYSYGGGWGFLKLAHELGRRGLEIETAILSDAVYRSKWIVGKWLAFVDWPIIRVPENVLNVYWFYQRMNRPRGHRVIASNTGRTKIHEGVQVHAQHVWLDDNPLFQKVAVEVAERAVAKSALEVQR